MLQSSRPALSVPGMRGKALHAPQLHPAALRVLTCSGGGKSKNVGESEHHRAAHQPENNGHLHLSAGQSAQPITGLKFYPSEVTERSGGVSDCITPISVCVSCACVKGLSCVCLFPGHVT